MRNRAFAQYTEFPNIVDQIPKPFTPELLKSGVANALQMGALVVQAQRTGVPCPRPSVRSNEAVLEGTTKVSRSGPSWTSSITASSAAGSRSRSARTGSGLRVGRPGSGGVSPTTGAERLEPALPDELGDLAPLLSVTLGEHQDASMTGLVKLLERSLSHPGGSGPSAVSGRVARVPGGSPACRAGSCSSR